MIRFLYGSFCLLCLLILAGALTGWVYSDRAASAGTSDAAAERTFTAGRYQLVGRHAHGIATLIGTPASTQPASAQPATTQPVAESSSAVVAPATQPALATDVASPRWQFGPAKFDAADGADGKTFYAQAPYWAVASVAALPLLLWLGLPKKRNPPLSKSCHSNLRGSPAQCRKCGSTFTVAQY